MTTYYTQKIRRYEDGITEAHVADDDGKQYIISTISFIAQGKYYDEYDFIITKMIPFSAEKWLTVRG